MTIPVAKPSTGRRLRNRVFRNTRNGIPASSGLSEAARAVLAEALDMQSIADPACLDGDDSVGSIFRMMLETVLQGPVRARSIAANDTRLESPWRATFEALDADRFAAALHELEAAGVVRREQGGLFLDFALIETLTKQHAERPLRGIVSTGANRTNLRPVVRKKIA
jgi:hypothetical protein